MKRRGRLKRLAEPSRRRSSDARRNERRENAFDNSSARSVKWCVLTPVPLQDRCGDEEAEWAVGFAVACFPWCNS